MALGCMPCNVTFDEPDDLYMHIMENCPNAARNFYILNALKAMELVDKCIDDERSLDQYRGDDGVY